MFTFKSFMLSFIMANLSHSDKDDLRHSDKDSPTYDLCPAKPEKAKPVSKTGKRVKTRMKLRRGITMDSGSHDKVKPRRISGRRKVRSSSGSRICVNYLVANDAKIPNEGEVDLDFETVEEHEESFVFQVANVNKALGAVSYVVEKRFWVVFGKDEKSGHDRSYMLHMTSGIIHKFPRV